MSKAASLDLSAHALTVLGERGIDAEWMLRTLTEPDAIESRADDTEHFLKAISERNGRVLRVVRNAATKRIVTAFFDRRMKGTP